MPSSSRRISFGLVHVSFLGKQDQTHYHKATQHDAYDASDTLVARGGMHHGRDRKALDRELTMRSFETSRANAANVPLIVGFLVFALRIK